MEKIKYTMMFQEAKLESMRSVADRMRWKVEYEAQDDDEIAAMKEIYESIIELIATIKPSK